MKIDSYASLSSVIYFLIVYFDSPNIDLLYRNLPICLGFSSIFDFVVDTPPRQNANNLKSATTRLYDTEAKIICIVSKKGAQCIECHHKDI